MIGEEQIELLSMFRLCVLLNFWFCHMDDFRCWSLGRRNLSLLDFFLIFPIAVAFLKAKGSDSLELDFSLTDCFGMVDCSTYCTGYLLY